MKMAVAVVVMVVLLGACSQGGSAVTGSSGVSDRCDVLSGTIGTMKRLPGTADLGDVDSAIAAAAYTFPSKPQCVVQVTGPGGDYADFYWIDWSYDTVRDVETSLEAQGLRAYYADDSHTYGQANYSTDGSVRTAAKLLWGADSMQHLTSGTFHVALLPTDTATTQAPSPNATPHGESTGMDAICPEAQVVSEALAATWVQNRLVTDDSCVYTQDGPSIDGAAVALSTYTSGSLTNLRSQAAKGNTVTDVPELGQDAFEFQSNAAEAGARCTVMAWSTDKSTVISAQATAGKNGQLADACAAAQTALDLLRH
ncbi:hypothetical protein [Cellulomonas sp. HZM]|uniref:hypothetical protein n=1 Tax=Cellulomonas sp. HZM TaxID=1454010 RepID=UPI00049382A8|nr:hypothetical protein [Cellulomonas sp. HZM]